MLHIQMKYTKYHSIKKISANDKTCFLFSYNLLYHKLKEPVWVAFKGECKISLLPPPSRPVHIYKWGDFSSDFKVKFRCFRS